MRDGTRGRISAAVLAVVLLVTMLSPIGDTGVASAQLTTAPTGLTPTAGTVVGGNPQLKWNRINDPSITVERYRVQVHTNPTFPAAGMLHNTVTYNSTFTAPTQLPTGTIYWRVAGLDGNADGVFSGTASFEVGLAGPTLTSPASGAVIDFPTQSPQFFWEPMPAAKCYRFEIDDAPDFVGATSINRRVNGLVLTTMLPIDQPQYWRVRGDSATSCNGVATPWSETREITSTWSQKPVLTKPANNTLATVTDLEFEWDPVPGAMYYEFQSSINIDFSTIFETAIVYGTRYSRPRTYDNGTYHWRVRARAVSNEYGPHSDISSFTRGWPDIPTLAAPLNGAHVSDPVDFQWTPIPNAGHYRLQIGSDQNFSPGTFTNCETLQTRYIYDYQNYTGAQGNPGSCGIAPRMGLVGNIYWRVQGVDQFTGVEGLWSETRSFSRARLPLAPYVSPAAGAVVSVPTLHWAPVEGAQRYRVRIYNSSNASVANVVTYATSYTHTNKLPAGEYSWYVQSIHQDNTESYIPHSSTWRIFNLVDPTFNGQPPDPITPPNGAASTFMPSMTWNPVENATRYEVWYANSGTPVFQSLVTNAANSGYTSHLTTLPAGQYDWYVKAFNGNTLLSESALGSFEIVTLQPATLVAPAHCPPGEPCSVHTSSPLFEWEPTVGAGGYLVYQSFDNNFTNVNRVWRAYTNQLIPRDEFPDNDAGQAYYWHVRPCKNIVGTPTGCSLDPSGSLAPSRAFQKRSTPVQLVSPANGATVPFLLRFEWEEYLDSKANDLGAREYRVQTSTVPTFATLLDNRMIDQPFFTPYGSTYPEGPIYWRVRAIDGSGNELTWSEVRTVHKTSPTPVHVAPANGASLNGLPTFTWQAQPFAREYEFELYYDGDLNFSAGNKVGSTIKTDHIHLTPFAYLPPGTYAWRIRAIDGQGKVRGWSAGQTFTLTGVSPLLSFPAPGDTIPTDDLVYSWFVLSAAESYIFERSASSSFSTIDEMQATIMTSHAPTARVPSGTWYWRVKAVDASGNVIGTSDGRAFTKVGADELPKNVSITRMPGKLRINWNHPDNLGSPQVNGYRVTLQPGGAPININNMTTTSHTFTGLTNGNDYDITVQPKVNNTLRPGVTRRASPNGCNQTPFSDIANNYLFCADIRWLYENEITLGVVSGDGTVNYIPASAVTRGAMAAFIYRFFGSPAYTPPATPSFSDIPKTHIFYKEIEWLVNEGVTTGYNDGTYRPNLSVTRGAMAAFLYRAANSPVFVAPNTPSFSDVPKTYIFYKEVEWLAETGVTTGYNDGTFKPGSAVTRGAMAAFMYRFFQYLNP